ncbi:hypothetical protein ACT3TZ_05990 [Brachybacterium sp. AOP25-B2-12]|uniref:hypothetical protein n=1 Tax=Brachybacterium sp. AOP25-B2-12 TaxID=3457710 RepID=UPI004033587A
MRRSIARTLVTVPSALALALGAAACDPGSDPTPTEGPSTTLAPGTTEVELAVGDTEQVGIGDVSPGIGDAWGVVARSDESVADAEVVLAEKVAGVEKDDATEPAEVGRPTEAAVAITGRTPGTTTVRVVYCYRTAMAEGCDQGPDGPVEPLEITVTVR